MMERIKKKLSWTLMRIKLKNADKDPSHVKGMLIFCSIVTE